MSSSTILSPFIDDGVDITPRVPGRDIDIGTGKLKDNDVTTGVALGDAGNTSYDTTNQTIIGATNENKTSIDFLKGIGSYATTLVDPALDSITIANVDDSVGIIITLTAAGNNQTLPTPTVVTTRHEFTVINNDTSTDPINIIGSSTRLLQPGDRVLMVWDGDAWIASEDPGLWSDNGTDILTKNSSRNIDTGTGDLLTTGSIVSRNTTNANTISIQSGITSASYTLTLPLAVAGAGEVLTDVAGDGILSWGPAGGVSWNDFRQGTDGVGLDHLVDSSAPSGTQSFRTILSNTQSNALDVIEIDLGTSFQAHNALKIIAKNNSITSSGILIEKKVNFGIRIINSGDASNTTAGFSYESAAQLEQSGTAYKALIESSRTNKVRSMDVQLIGTGETVGRTNDSNYFLSSRATSQVLTDAYNAFYIKKTLTKTGGGTFTNSGAALKVENDMVEASGTLNDTSDALEVIQSADAGGSPVKITQNAVVSTNFIKIITESNTGTTMWIGDGATNPDTNLSAQAGDICLNGDAGNIYRCTGTTNWTAT